MRNKDCIYNDALTQDTSAAKRTARSFSTSSSWLDRLSIKARIEKSENILLGMNKIRGKSLEQRRGWLSNNGVDVMTWPGKRKRLAS